MSQAPRIVAAVLAHNEAGEDRYLKRVLDNCNSLCDTVLVVDDGSTDDTGAVAGAMGALVRRFEPAEGHSEPFWGTDETSRRKFLWDEAAQVVGPSGWIYVADADHELMGLSRADLRTLCKATLCNAWAWPLMDCWDSDRQYRVDGYWVAWANPRPWLFRAQPFSAREQPFSTWEPEWPARGIHAGHAPANYPLIAGVAPGWIRHLSYVNPKHRQRKAERYLALAS